MRSTMLACPGRGVPKPVAGILVYGLSLLFVGVDSTKYGDSVVAFMLKPPYAHKRFRSGRKGLNVNCDASFVFLIAAHGVGFVGCSFRNSYLALCVSGRASGVGVRCMTCHPPAAL